MFNKVALDINDKKGPVNRRFYGCVRFVADKCTPAVFYVSKNWASDELLRSAGIDVNALSPEQETYLKQQDLYPDVPHDRNTPALVYLEEGAWELPEDPNTGLRNGLVVPKREMVLSSSPYIHKAHLVGQGLNAQTAILCLAAVGLDVVLPNLSFDLIADEEIERMKEDFRGERIQYLEIVTGIAEQAYDGLRAGNFTDVRRWAESEVAFKLVPKARILEEAVAKGSARHLRQAGYSFWKEGVPSIGAAYMTGGIGAASISAGREALKTLVGVISATKEERTLPEIAYAMRIKKAVENSGDM